MTEKTVAGKTALRVAKDLANSVEGGQEFADKMGEIIRVLQANKSRYVKLGENRKVDEGVEDEEHCFQMSTFRRRNVWEEEEEEATETPPLSEHTAPALSQATLV